LTGLLAAYARERRAADYYVSYWDEVSPLDEEATLSVQTRELAGAATGGGTLVDVTDGGDESGITFVFDAGDKLVALFQHNQSPDAQFFCRASSAARRELAGVEDCVGALVNAVPHDTDLEEEVDLTASMGALPSGLGAEVRTALARFAATGSVASTSPIAAAGVRWDEGYAPASRLTVTAPGERTTTYLATSELVLLEAPSGRAAQLVCE